VSFLNVNGFMFRLSFSVILWRMKIADLTPPRNALFYPNETVVFADHRDVDRTSDASVGRVTLPSAIAARSSSWQAPPIRRGSELITRDNGP
jgi:hypothetical protein